MSSSLVSRLRNGGPCGCGSKPFWAIAALHPSGRLFVRARAVRGQPCLNPLRRREVALSRKFVDSEGVHWQVYELTSDAGPAAMGADSWLYFFSRSATRSLAAYPDDWGSMEWPALERLCRLAHPPAARRQKPAPPRVHGVEW